MQIRVADLELKTCSAIGETLEGDLHYIDEDAGEMRSGRGSFNAIYPDNASKTMVRAKNPAYLISKNFAESSYSHTEGILSTAASRGHHLKWAGNGTGWRRSVGPTME